MSQQLEIDLNENNLIFSLQQEDIESRLFNKSETSVSELYPSFDSFGNVALSFGIDFKKMLYTNIYYKMQFPTGIFPKNPISNSVVQNQFLYYQFSTRESSLVVYIWKTI